MADPFASVDEYIAAFPQQVQEVLQSVRRTMRAHLPKADEVISYQIPTSRLHGRNVVHFAGWKRHVSVYPLPRGDAEFEARLDPYRSGKGTARFELSEPVPYDLIGLMVELLAKERVDG